MELHQERIFTIVMFAIIIIAAAYIGLKSSNESVKNTHTLVENYDGEKLIVAFEFADEPCDITIYTPSGLEAEVSCVESGKYATYTVLGDIEPGTWTFSYPASVDNFHYTISN